MSTVADTLAQLRQEAQGKLSEAEQLEKLVAAYPDLQKYVGRWNKVAYYSKTVNAQANRFDLRHNCGCCADSPLELWPYLETELGKVYTDPPSFQIGEKHWICGDTSYPGWKDKLRAAGISEEIIGAAQEHFREGRQSRMEAAYEDDDE